MEVPLPSSVEIPTGAVSIHIYWCRDIKRWKVHTHQWFLHLNDPIVTESYVDNDGHTGTDLTNHLIHVIEEFENTAVVPF